MARKAVPHSPLIPLLCLLLSIPAVADYQINYIHTDHRGAPVAITDPSQTVIWRASYKPFGEAILQQDPDNDGVNTVMNIRYPGQYYDQETGTYYNYYRDYDPQLGRYIQSDPIGLRGGLNTYAYVGGNPLTYTDPFGLRGTRYGISPGLGTPSGVRVGLSGTMGSTTWSYSKGSASRGWSQNWGQTTQLGVGLGIQICSDPNEGKGGAEPCDETEDPSVEVDYSPDGGSVGVGRNLGITGSAEGVICINLGASLGLPFGASWEL